jgi:hypothetical protein
MYYYLNDELLPPSLSSYYALLQRNEFLVYCSLPTIVTTSAYIFNPGTNQPEQYYDAYNVVSGDWLASDWTQCHMHHVEIHLHVCLGDSMSASLQQGLSMESDSHYQCLHRLD